MARMAKRNAYRVVVREKTKTPLGRLSNRWEDNIKMDVTEMGREGCGLDLPNSGQRVVAE